MIGLVLVTYAHWPDKLLASVAAAGRDVRWYIHHHGADPAFTARVAALGERADTRLHLHGENRGLSRSWNEGIHEALADGCTHAMLVNDDLHFVDGGFAAFADFARESDPLSIAFLHGLETGGSPLAGQVIQQGFACCTIPPAVIERVGWFDQTFTPAYYEDYDYYRRCVLSGVAFVMAPGVLAEHERSKTTRDNPEIRLAHDEIMARNCAYYTAKWGAPGEETFTRPFDDPDFDTRIAWANRADPYAKPVAPEPPPPVPEATTPEPVAPAEPAAPEPEARGLFPALGRGLSTMAARLRPRGPARRSPPDR